jgi:RNA polymerase-binding transcription factor DksA
MPRDERMSPAAITPVLPAAAHGPRWRALLEARWQACLREVTELSLAYHVAAAADPGGAGDGAAHPEIRALLRRTVAARRKLANVEEALARLTAGTFGPCEQCGSPIPCGLLASRPETRYCPRCDHELVRTHALTGPEPR